MPYHDELLSQALELVHSTPASQASLRRSVSSAYYAVFHLLIAEATSNWNNQPLRSALGRGFNGLPTRKGSRTRPCGTPWRGLKRASATPTLAAASSSSGRAAGTGESPADTGRSSFSGKASGLSFVYGFPKSARDNIDQSDEKGFKTLAKALLAASDEALAKLVKEGKYLEVESDEQE